VNASPSVTVFAPAKLNLFLAVTGRRPDGFHELVSLAAPLDFGDDLVLEPQPEAAADELVCDAPDVPSDSSNLVLRAAAVWRAAGGRAPYVRFALHKTIPAGAGLGGGSSDAVAALRGLQQIGTVPVPAAALGEGAAGLGSDCPLFLAGAPVVMRGRGERLSPLPAVVRERLVGQRVLVCKPAFGVDTAWAYGRLAAGAPNTYWPVAEAEARLAAWTSGAIPLEALMGNSFESVVFAKFAALPALAVRLRERCGLTLHLTGSGSACFALMPPEGGKGDPVAEIRAAWGEGAFVRETRLRQIERVVPAAFRGE
jgi:4-diphosphocytidyl-2-C-methyl-D-erythritol kinase